MPSSVRDQGAKTPKPGRNQETGCRGTVSAMGPFRMLSATFLPVVMRQVTTATLWADVLAADAFSRFEEEGIFNRETGQSFLRQHSEPWRFRRADGAVQTASVVVNHSWMRCWSITALRADHSAKICLIDETGAGDGALSVLAARWGWKHDEDNLMALVLTPEHLELRKRDEPETWRHLC